MKRLFLMSGIVLLAAACAFFTACTQQVAEPEESATAQAEPQSAIEGVWELGEAYGRNAEGDWRWDPIQPGLQIFHDGYYSVTFVRGNEPRPLFDEDETGATASEEKLRAIHTAFVHNAGTFEVNGSTLTTTPMVAKNPNLTQGTLTPAPRTFRLDGDVLTLRVENEDGSWTEQRWRRLQ